jgi:hypothetical protein
MSETPALQLTPAEQQKSAAWAKMGVAVHQREMALQVQAQQIIGGLKTPTKIEEVQVAEDALRAAKAHLAALVEARKEITGRFDAVTTRMMLPEKSVAEALTSPTNAVISVKKAHEAAQANSAKKQAELQALRQLVIIYTAQIHAARLNQLNELLSNAYTHALQNIPPDQLETYLPKVAARVTEAGYTIPAPKATPVLLNAEEVAAEITTSFNPQPAKWYIDYFAQQMSLKFSDYQVAWNNKVVALAQNATEVVQAQAAVKDEAKQATVAASLEAAAMPMEVGPVVKELRQSYEVDMPETVETALALMTAFVSHAPRCLGKLKVNKWFGLSLKQLAGALAKVKDDEPDFAPAGITFKTVDKL